MSNQEKICINCEHLKILNKNEARLLGVEYTDNEVYLCVKEGTPVEKFHQISQKKFLEPSGSRKCVEVYHPNCDKYEEKLRGIRYNIKNKEKRKAIDKPFLGVELYTFLQKCNELPLEYRVLWKILFWSGRRCAEILGRRTDNINSIKKCQIDFKNNVIDDIEIVKKRDQTVHVSNPLPVDVINDLKVLTEKMKPDDIIFRKGYYHYYREFKKIWTEHAPHDLRASFACYFYEKNNNNILVVKQLLQHSSVETSEVYLRGLLGANFQQIIRDAFHEIKIEDV